MANYPDKVFLNGEIIPSTEAKVSVFDRGFLFGDGIYEVMLQINGSYFFGQEHLNRLSECLHKINIEYDVTVLPEILKKLVSVSNLEHKDCLIYIQVTRGIAPRKHAFPLDIEPTVMAYALPFLLPEINDKPISVITQKDFRWHRCDIKMTSLLGNVMANDWAIKNGHFETVFYRDDKITEASHSNIFFVKNDVVYTHPADENILNGITRAIVINLCKKNNIEVQEEAIMQSDLPMVNEAFLTGTSTQIAAINMIDDHVYIKNNKIGPITKKIQQLFLNLKNSQTKRLPQVS
ncbi:aminotransferase class IV [Aurantibacter sp.]|uniref:aminotransferase class IV n=1 Tax=Aurantibacter sp. TaxID=2807103 RepID=UPI0032651F6B